MPDATSESDDRSERRFVWERQPEFPLFGETRILECLWVKTTLMKGSICLSHLTFTELNNHPTVMGLQVMWTPSEVAGAVAMVAGIQARPLKLGTVQRGGPYQHPSKNQQTYHRENSIWSLPQNANVQVPVIIGRVVAATSL